MEPAVTGRNIEDLGAGNGQGLIITDKGKGLGILIFRKSGERIHQILMETKTKGVGVGEQDHIRYLGMIVHGEGGERRITGNDDRKSVCIEMAYLGREGNGEGKVSWGIMIQDIQSVVHLLVPDIRAKLQKQIVRVAGYILKCGRIFLHEQYIMENCLILMKCAALIGTDIDWQHRIILPSHDRSYKKLTIFIQEIRYFENE